MSRRKQHTLDQLSTSPTYLTTLGPRLPDGRCRSSMDNSVWLYGSVPMSPIRDSVDSDAQLEAMDGLHNTLEELTRLTSTSSTRRYTAKSSYREIHLLLINVPEYFHLPWDDPHAKFLNKEFGDEVVDRRLLMIGVRLRDKWGGGGTFKDLVDSTAAFIADRMVPMADFDSDYKKVAGAFARAGVSVPTASDFKLADAYWSGGKTPATPTLPHLEHLHVFRHPNAMRQAEILGAENCDALEVIPGQGVVTYASVTDFNYEFDAPDAPHAAWATELLDEDAIAVSVRGYLEPAKITGKELRRQRKRFIQDIDERVKQNKMSLPEQDEQLELLEKVEHHYGAQKPNPTLIDASIIVAFSGIKDIDDTNTDSMIELAPMQLVQPGAMAETWLCSTVQANPRRHDLPIQVISASGMSNLSFIGDEDGAALGFTEHDNQLARLSARGLAKGDRLPITVGYASTGGGKTLLMLWLAKQWARTGESVIFVDPKFESDHSNAVKKMGVPHQIVRLDEIKSADGIFDSMRHMPDDAGLSQAARTILYINPFGPDRAAYEQPLTRALKCGKDNGATCIGQALLIAQDLIGDQLPPDLVSKVMDLRDSDPVVSAQIGRDPTADALSVAQGLTLIMVGKSSLPLPESMVADSLPERAAVSLVRQMVFGSSSALAAHGGGAVMLDEAWTFLEDPREVKTLGRIARSQRVHPLLFTQRPSDVIRHNLASFISRTLIGPLVDDTDEAADACRAAGVDYQRYGPRITAENLRQGTSGQRAVVNWNSMRHLVDPTTGELLRGSVWLYRDITRSVVPVRAALPPDHLAEASTNPDDVEARAARALQEVL